MSSYKLLKRLPGIYLTGLWEFSLKILVSNQIIFKLILVIDVCNISCGIALRWMSLDLTDDKLTLVLVMVWWANIDPHLCCHMASPGHNVLILLAQLWKYYHIYIRDILVKKITQNFQFYIFKHWPLPVIAEQGSWRSGYLHCLCNIHQGSTMLLDGSWQKKGKIQVTNYRNILQHLTH